MNPKRLLKDYALLWAMIIGGLTSQWVHHLAFLLPYSLFVMLSLSYTKIAPKDLKITKAHIAIFVIQWTLGPLVFFLLKDYNRILAEGIALIILTPTATSAPVITGMMGGNMGFVTAFLIPSNIVMAILSPLLISYLYPEANGSYSETVLQILSQVAALLLLPIVIVWGLRLGARSFHDQLARHSGLTFYVWCFALVIVAGNTLHFFLEHEELNLGYSLLLAGVTFLTSIILFGLGRATGERLGEGSINSGQTLGQKNTVLAIWIALTFMDPIVSLLPSFYVLWQNVINSFELARHEKVKRKKLPPLS